MCRCGPLHLRWACVFLTVVVGSYLSARVTSSAVPSNEEPAVKTVRFDGPCEVHVATTPDIRRVAVSASFPPPRAQNRLSVYDGTGKKLWTVRADGGKLRVLAISPEDGAVVAFRYRAGDDRTTDDNAVKSILTFNGVTGAVVAEVPLRPADVAGAASADGQVLVMLGDDPRLLRRDGTVLCQLGNVRPPFPVELDWTEAPVLLAPNGSYALVGAGEQTRELFQVTAEGDRIWELHLGSGFVSCHDRIAPRFSRTGGYLLLNGEFSADAAMLHVVPKTHAGPLFVARPQVGASGSCLILLKVGRPEGMQVPGGCVSLLWAESTLMASPLASNRVPHPNKLLDADVMDTNGAVVIVAVGTAGLRIIRLAPNGKWLEGHHIPLDTGPIAAKVAVGGDPPYVLVAYNVPGAADGLSVRLFSMHGEEVSAWTSDGDVWDAWLAPTGGHAVVQAGTALHFLSFGRQLAEER